MEAHVPTATITPQTSSQPEVPEDRALKVAYIVSRFPKLTETFVLNEILALESQGVDVEVYPLLGAGNAATKQGASFLCKVVELIRKPTGRPVMHPEASAWLDRARYLPFFSWAILRAHWYFLWRKPGTYFSALWSLLCGTMGSLNYFLGGLAIFPKTVRIAYEMKLSGATHVHAHFANHPTTAAFLVHRLTGIPYSFTAHGSDLHRDRKMLTEKVHDAMQVVTVSNYNRELIVDECGEQYRDKIVVIHCGVDTEVFQSLAEDAHDDSTDTFNILCIGTMHEVKGHAYLIEACRLLNERGIDFKCHLVGDGPDKEVLCRQAAASGIADRVIFHGLRTRGEIVELLKHAHVVAAPSVLTKDGRREGIPVVLMEAMASGVPVVASKLSGIPELVEDGIRGLLAAPGDVNALAGALQQLHDEPDLRRQLGRAGRQKVVREFDLQKNANQLAHGFRAWSGPTRTTST